MDKYSFPYKHASKQYTSSSASPPVPDGEVIPVHLPDEHRKLRRWSSDLLSTQMRVHIILTVARGLYAHISNTALEGTVTDSPETGEVCAYRTVLLKLYPVHTSPSDLAFSVAADATLLVLSPHFEQRGSAVPVGR